MKIIESQNLKAKPSSAQPFGTTFTDYMFVMDYESGKGWHNERIEPYAPFVIDPACAVLHYGQSVFEGMKAYKSSSGEVFLFRPEENLARLNSSSGRMMIPPIDEQKVLGYLKELIKLESDWVPDREGESLYIRPAIIANETTLSVHASNKYLFYIILSPVGAYYAGGIAPVKLYVEDFYVRAAKGGTGHYKFGGNYAGSLKAGYEAEAKGFDQVMWLDAAEHKYVEEVGSMNIFFVIGGKVVTPKLAGSILPGITRKSVIELLGSMGYTIEERLISIDEVTAAAQNGTLTECFGTGTAAVVSPVSNFRYKGIDYPVGNGQSGEITMLAYNTLTSMQYGKIEDKFGWVVKVK